MQEKMKPLTDEELNQASGGLAVKNEMTTIEVYCVGGDFSRLFKHVSKEVCEDQARGYMKEKQGRCEKCGKVLKKRDCNNLQML